VRNCESGQRQVTFSSFVMLYVPSENEEWYDYIRPSKGYELTEGPVLSEKQPFRLPFDKCNSV
jgi:hypothetical protein